jgi:hypothetical protein
MTSTVRVATCQNMKLEKNRWTLDISVREQEDCETHKRFKMTI